MTQTNQRYYRKVIKIRAEDSPSVRLGFAQQRKGLPQTNEKVIPGVLDWDTYKKRRKTWDKIRQCTGLDAEFYEGAEILLYPPEWLNWSERYAELLRGRVPRKAVAMGVDPAEGGDSTAISVVDYYGLIELVSKKTPDTSVVTGEVLAMMHKYNLPPDRVVFDRGGGGKQHADRLRDQGYPVCTVAFGEAVSLDPKYGTTSVRERIETKEDRYVYKNRRAEMYGEFHILLDPGEHLKEDINDVVSWMITSSKNGDGASLYDGIGFAIPAIYTELRRQLAPIPKTFDGEGRLYILPKQKPNPNHTGPTLTDLIGCSPDEADSLVLAVHGMLHKTTKVIAGAIG